MAVPEQVRKQAEAAQKHFEELNTPTEVGTEVPTEPVVEAPQAEQPVADIPPPTPPASSAEDFRQKYLSLQGMYNAEVPRLHNTAKEQAARIKNLEELIANMQAPPAQEREPQRFLSDTELSEYGESVEVMRKAAHEVASPLYERIQYLEGVIENLSGTVQQNVLPQVTQVAQQQQVTAQDQFWGNLTRLVPNWQEVNRDEAFHSWLLEVDPMAGVTRQSMLEAAQGRLRADNVAAFFTAWMNATGKYKPNNGAPPAAKSPSELEKQVAPGRSRSASAPSQGTSKTYSQRDIATFFDEVRKGKYKGREDERAKIERDIFAAQRDGRIVAA